MLAHGMGKESKRDQCLQDIDRRQRNLVFPDTVQNEARFWRNLGTSSWTTSTKAGMVVLGLFVAGWLSVFLRAGFENPRVWLLFPLVILLWGVALVILSWALRRALRDIKSRDCRPGPRNR